MYSRSRGKKLSYAEDCVKILKRCREAIKDKNEGRKGKHSIG